MTSSTWTCPCCGRTYTPFDDMRQRAGTWVNKKTGEVYEFICERCHRAGKCFRRDVDT